MSNSQVSIVMDGKEAGMLRAFSAVYRAIEQSEGGLKKVSAESRRLAAENRELERAGKQLWESTRTPLERYNQRLGELQRLLAQDKISYETLQRAVGQAQQELKKQQDALSGVAEASRQARVEQDKMAASGRQTWESTRTPLERYNARLGELQRQLKAGAIDQQTYSRAAKDAAEQMAQAQEKVAGASAISQLGQLVAGYVSVSAAIGVASKALTDFAEKQQQAAQRAKESAPSGGTLAQLAYNEQDYAALRNEANRVYAKGATESLQEANDLVFSVVSAGQEREMDLVARMKATGVVQDPRSMMRAADAMKTALGEKETGGFRQIVGKGLAASQGAPLRAEELLVYAARSGVDAAAIGLSDEEVLAAAGTFAKATGSGEMAGTALAALSRSLARVTGRTKEEAAAEKLAADEEVKKLVTSKMTPKQIEGLTKRAYRAHGLTAAGEGAGFELKGKSLLGMVEEISAADLDAAELQKLLGDQEAVKGFRLMRTNRTAYQQLLGRVQRSQTGDFLEKRVRWAEEDPTISAAIAARAAKAKKELSETEMGEATNLANAIQDDMETRMRNSGYSEPAIWAARKMDDWNRWLNFSGDKQWAQQNRDFGGQETRRKIDANLNRGEASAWGPARETTVTVEGGQDLKDAAGELRAAAKDLRDSRDSRNRQNPTLVPPNVDR